LVVHLPELRHGNTKVQIKDLRASASVSQMAAKKRGSEAAYPIGGIKREGGARCHCPARDWLEPIGLWFGELWGRQKGDSYMALRLEASVSVGVGFELTCREAPRLGKVKVAIRISFEGGHNESLPSSLKRGRTSRHPGGCSIHLTKAKKPNRTKEKKEGVNALGYAGDLRGSYCIPTDQKEMRKAFGLLRNPPVQSCPSEERWGVSRCRLHRRDGLHYQKKRNKTGRPRHRSEEEQGNASRGGRKGI